MKMKLVVRQIYWNQNNSFFILIINWCGYLLVALTSSWIPKEVRLSIGVLLRLSRITHLYPQVASFYFIVKGIFSCPSFFWWCHHVVAGWKWDVYSAFWQIKGDLFQRGVIIWEEGLISGFYVLWSHSTFHMNPQTECHPCWLETREHSFWRRWSGVFATNCQKIWFNLMDLKSLPF